MHGFFGLGVGGEPRLYVADEEDRPIGGQGAFRRIVAERGTQYQALLFGAPVFAGGIGGAWIAGAASASFRSLPAAIVTTFSLIVFAGWLILARRTR